MEKNSRSSKHHIIDDNEDLEIKRIAYNKKKNYILISLVMIFSLMLITTAFYIYSYYKTINSDDSQKVIEIFEENNKILITNVGEINEKITYNFFSNKEDKIIEKINSIELFAKKNSLDDNIIYFNVKLNIEENEFKQNIIPTIKSDLLIRISYSYDNKNWVYINNVLQTDNTTISPLMGNYYDIAGIKSEIKVITKKELSCKANETKKMYWKIETKVKNSNDKDYNKKLKMNFYIEYKDNI